MWCDISEILILLLTTMKHRFRYSLCVGFLDTIITVMIAVYCHKFLRMLKHVDLEPPDDSNPFL